MPGTDDLVDLEDALIVIETRDEVDALLTMLMTPTERTTFQHRWAAMQLSVGGARQRAIRDGLNVSIATASRAARAARANPELVRTLAERTKQRV